MPRSSSSSTRFVLPAIITVFILYYFFFSSPSDKTTAPLMERHDLSATPLTVSLEPLHPNLNPHQPCVIDVSVTNTGDSKLTVLNWNSPLDPKASLLGVFEVHDVETGKQIQTMTLMLNRKRPPPPQDLVEFGAQEVVTTQATLNGIDFTAGRTYSIRAKGRWQAVWDTPKDDVLANSERLENLADASRSLFESETAVVTQLE